MNIGIVRVLFEFACSQIVPAPSVPDFRMTPLGLNHE
jgi:hypothetical protein